MKTIKILVLLFLTLSFMGCKNDEVRDELPGTPTTITGNVKDYHRNIYINNFEIKLVKVWDCGISGNLTPLTCDKEIAKVYTDAYGNYTLKFDYNLRSDEKYRIVINETAENKYYKEFILGNGSFYSNYETSNLIKGEKNIININAWKPVILKFNLTVLNNNNPPLYTTIYYNDKYDFGSESIYNSFKTFEMKTRPNSDVKIKFSYTVNNNTSNTTHNAPPIDYNTTEKEITELNYTVNCKDF